MGNTTLAASRLTKLSLTLLAGLGAGLVQADDKELDTVIVSAKAEDNSAWMQPDSSTPSTVYRVDREAMRLFDTPGGANPYTALAEVPGVKVTTVDAYGLNNMQGGQKGMRVRGEVSTHGVAGTVEGLALGGPGPGPGYLFLFDKENLASISFAQGAVAADRAGLFNTYGAIDSRLRWPGTQAGADLSLSSGSDSFRRLFARVDSGLLASGTAFFFSASDTSADKWRGQGEAPSGRENLEFAVQQKFGDLKIKLALAQNVQAQNNYKALTYAQASDLDRYGKYDYGSNRNNADYYGYNKQDFTSQAVLSEIEYALTPATTLSVKPYYAKEEGYYLYAGSTNTQVQRWLIDHETYGVTGELRSRLGNTDLKLGYAWTSTEPPGPPTTRKQYSVVGGQLVFQQWAMLSKVVNRHEFSNYYLSGQHRLGDLTLQAGLRYAHETLPGIDAYKVSATTGSKWDVSPDEAIARAQRDPSRSVSSRSFGNWLPQAGLAWEINQAVEVHGSLGRNIGAPSFDAFNQAPAGKITTSQQYWDQIEPELSTSLDLGARIRGSDWYVDPTIYFSRSSNKAVSVFSSTTNTVYSQNIGKTAGRGLQLASGWTALSNLQLFTAISYSLSEFSENVRTNGGATLAVDGKQLPDVPKLMANLGGIWRMGGLTVAPIVQYVGQRWATSTYSERMAGYTTTDLHIGYGDKGSWGKWQASLAVMNLFDRQYIGQISTSEVNTTANGAIYYPGAPRTVVATLGLSF